MNDAFVGTIVHCWRSELHIEERIGIGHTIKEILSEIARKCLDINSVPMILARNVTAASGQVQARNVVGSISVYQKCELGISMRESRSAHI